MNETTTCWPIRVHSLADFDASNLPEFVVEDLLLSGEVSMLVGPSNTGKTAVAIQLAHHVATGTPLLGRDVRRGMVLYVAAEGARSVLTRAHAAFRDEEGREHFVALEMLPDLLDRTCVDEIIALARQLMEEHGVGFALIIVDTFVLSIGDNDESNNVEMARAILGGRRIAEALSAHVLQVHHVGKDADRGSRGASSLRANIDTELLCTSSGRHTGQVQQTKQRSLEKGYGIGYRLAPVEVARDAKGRAVTAVVAAFETIDEQAIPAPDAKPRSVDPLEVAIEILLSSRAPATDGLTAVEIKGRLPARLFNPKAKEDSHNQAVKRALSELERQGVVIAEKGGRSHRWSLSPNKSICSA